MLPASLLAKSSRTVKEWNQRPVEKAGMREEDRSRLEQFYVPWNEHLKTVSGLDLTIWKRSGS